METRNCCQISPEAIISPDARIIPSSRGTSISIGSHTHIFEFVVIRAVGGTGDVEIGERCYINPHCVFYSGNGIKIGNDVLIAAGTVIAPANHAFGNRDKLIREQGFQPTRGGVIIEDDVWIGSNVTILDGAVVRRGSVIMAGAVVNCLVPEYTIWGGIPARFIKER